jgi:hypothetical protein
MALKLYREASWMASRKQACKMPKHEYYRVIF